MSRYEEGLKIVEEMCGNGKDNVISLATLHWNLTQMANPVLLSVKLMLYMRMVCSMLLLGQNRQKYSR